MIQFFNPNGVLAPSCGEIQTDSSAKSRDRGQGLGVGGDEAASHYSNHKVTRTETYKNFQTSGTITVPKCGAIVSGWHIDSIGVKYSLNDFPEITVTGHKHGSTPTNHPTCRTYTATVTLPAGFGVPRTVCGITLGTDTVSAAVGITSAEYSLAVTHKDENDGMNEFLAAENRDGVETLKITLTGTGATITPPEGFEAVGDDNTTHGNDAAEGETVSFVQHIAYDTPQDEDEDEDDD